MELCLIELEVAPIISPSLLQVRSRHKVARQFVVSYIFIHEALASKSHTIFQEKRWTWPLTHILISDKIYHVKDAYGDHALTNYPGFCRLIRQASCDNFRKKNNW